MTNVDKKLLKQKMGAHITIYTPLRLLGFLEQCHAELSHHQETGTEQ